MAHLKDQATKADFEMGLRSLVNGPVLQRLQDILDQKIQQTRRSSDYSNPNWAADRAHRDGKEEAYTEIKDLFNLT